MTEVEVKQQQLPQKDKELQDSAQSYVAVITEPSPNGFPRMKPK